MAHSSDGYREWTVNHDLGLIFLALMHGADDELDASELNAMSQKLRDWNESLAVEHVREIMDDVILVYMGAAGRAMLETAIASVGNSTSKSTRIAILQDLADIATADGTVVMGEVDFIQQLARDWGVERDLR